MFNGFRTHYEKWYRIFRQYSNRFLFATDAATHATPESLQNRAGYVLRFLKTDDEYFVRENCTAHGIRLEQEHLEKILYRNHERTVGKDPNPIDKAALKKHIERYLPLMPNTRNRALTEAYFRKNLL
jgi:predicted TIM-barrel fold metal-dependent hydrolase